jgi:K+-sensing histidine kinase KdpD
VRDNEESLFYSSAGPLAAILLGGALVPLRGLTPASNLSFAFIALTIVVAELGGRWAALATALVSALSLDFFLTQPYLRLSIEDKHDVIAFVGLAVCGLIAASLAAQRRHRLAALSAYARQGALLGSLLRRWDASAPLEPQLSFALSAAKEVFPLAAIVVRDESGRVVAGSDSADELRPVPELALGDDVMPPAGAVPGAWRAALPETGGRIALATGDRRLGWLDIWGDGAPAGAESRRALADVARLIGLLLGNATASASRD